MAYDVIGDVHGCATKLRVLLEQMGYRERHRVYEHPERTAVFVGDLIDRGPEHLEVLSLVKAMADAGTARVAMGNHEFNAICYATPDPAKPGEFLREHNDDNTRNHKDFLELDDADRRYYLDWFATLPLWLDLDGLRVVHACWHEPSIRTVREACGSDRLETVEHFAEASRKGSALYEAVEILLKGPEIPVPHQYRDHGGKPRDKARLRWWDSDARTLKDLADVRGMKAVGGGDYPPLPPAEVDPEHLSFVYADSVPVIYGHYWFEWEHNRDDWTERTACVDFSAIRDDGRLVAYRWNGEPTIRWENYLPHDPDVVSPLPSA